MIKITDTQPNIEDAISYMTESGQEIRVTVLKKVYNIGIFEDVSLYPDSGGSIIGEDFYYRAIKMLNGKNLTAKMPLKGISIQYYLPTIAPNFIIKVEDSAVLPDLNSMSEVAEKIIALMIYSEKIK